MQYHQNVKPGEGESLYSQFCEGLVDLKARAGVYGARQVVSMETNGPFSHVLDL